MVKDRPRMKIVCDGMAARTVRDTARSGELASMHIGVTRRAVLAESASEVSSRGVGFSQRRVACLAGERSVSAHQGETGALAVFERLLQCAEGDGLVTL